MSTDGLTLETVVPYLLEHDHLAPAQVIDPSFAVELRVRRNRNFRIHSRPRGLLIKQPRELDDEHRRRTVRWEGRLLEAFARRKEYRRARWALPRFVFFDERSTVLGSELVSPSPTLARYFVGGDVPRFDPVLTYSVATSLADLHAAGRAALEGGMPLEDIKRGHRERRASEVRFLRVARELIDGARLREALDRKGEERSLVHGDLRWENVLLTKGYGSSDRINLRVIDWELAEIDEPERDVAAYLAEFARFYVRNRAAKAQSGSGSAFSWAQAHGAACGFLAHYAQRRGLRQARRHALARRVVDLLPGALVRVAKEFSREVDGIPGESVELLRLANRLLEHPVKTARTCWGIALR